MPEPSPYEQGFRDALLSVKAQLHGLNTDRPCSVILREVEDNLNAVLTQKNHDLWSVLALAQVDLSVGLLGSIIKPALSAPNGVLIDSEGRMLYMRIRGTEYDTGVLGLLTENAQLKTEIADLTQKLEAWKEPDSER